MGDWLKDSVDLLRHRKAGKRALRRLPKEEIAHAYNEGWLDRFWNLPESEWSAAVDLRLEGWSLREKHSQRDRELDALWKAHQEREQQFWSEHGYPADPSPEPGPEPSPRPEPEPPTAEELAELHSIAETLRSEQPPAPIRLTGKFAEAQQRFEQAESLIKGAPRHLGPPWDAWIASLPAEDREEGTLACLLWRDMIDLRNRLHEAVKERHVLAGILEGEAQKVLDVRMFELRGKIRACENGFSEFAPFFERYGKPPLAEVGQTTRGSKGKPGTERPGSSKR